MKFSVYIIQIAFITLPIVSQAAGLKCVGSNLDTNDQAEFSMAYNGKFYDISISTTDRHSRVTGFVAHDPNLNCREIFASKLFTCNNRNSNGHNWSSFGVSSSHMTEQLLNDEGKIVISDYLKINFERYENNANDRLNLRFNPQDCNAI